MEIIFRLSGEKKTLEGKMKVSHILTELEINPETVIVLKDGQVVPRDRVIKDEETIEIIPVVSGG